VNLLTHGSHMKSRSCLWRSWAEIRHKEVSYAKSPRVTWTPKSLSGRSWLETISRNKRWMNAAHVNYGWSNNWNDFFFGLALLLLVRATTWKSRRHFWNSGFFLSFVFPPTILASPFPKLNSTSHSTPNFQLFWRRPTSPTPSSRRAAKQRRKQWRVTRKNEAASKLGIHNPPCGVNGEPYVTSSDT